MYICIYVSYRCIYTPNFIDVVTGLWGNPDNRKFFWLLSVWGWYSSMIIRISIYAQTRNLIMAINIFHLTIKIWLKYFLLIILTVSIFALNLHSLNIFVILDLGSCKETEAASPHCMKHPQKVRNLLTPQLRKSSNLGLDITLVPHLCVRLKSKLWKLWAGGIIMWTLLTHLCLFAASPQPPMVLSGTGLLSLRGGKNEK